MPGISATDSAFLAPFFTTEAMRAVFSDRARLQAMLDFEAALARAEADAGVIPAEAAEAISAACDADAKGGLRAPERIEPHAPT